MDDLKPCPFCGLSAKAESGTDWLEITCLCGYTFQHADQSLPGETVWAAMIRSWNSRPTEAAAVAAERARILGLVKLMLSRTHANDYPRALLNELRLAIESGEQPEENLTQAIVEGVQACTRSSSG